MRLPRRRSLCGPGGGSSPSAVVDLTPLLGSESYRSVPALGGGGRRSACRRRALGDQEASGSTVGAGGVMVGGYQWPSSAFQYPGPGDPADTAGADWGGYHSPSDACQYPAGGPVAAVQPAGAPPPRTG